MAQFVSVPLVFQPSCAGRTGFTWLRNATTLRFQRGPRLALAGAEIKITRAMRGPTQRSGPRLRFKSRELGLSTIRPDSNPPPQIKVRVRGILLKARNSPRSWLQ